jgi:uncharacterized protein (UPF0335 family)
MPDRSHHATCWREHHACAVARVERLEAEIAALDSTYETWRQVIAVVRRRIERWRREEAGRG